MTEKLKVSREVADAIESLNRNSFTVSTNIQRHADGGWKSAERAPLNMLSLEELATALINGYEVEMTPHERIHESYKHSEELMRENRNPTNAAYNEGCRDGILRTLDQLGITVKGVNDK